MDKFIKIKILTPDANNLISRIEINKVGYYAGSSERWNDKNTQLTKDLIDSIGKNNLDSIDNQTFYRCPKLSLPREKMNVINQKYNTKVIRDISKADIVVIPENFENILFENQYKYSLDEKKLITFLNEDKRIDTPIVGYYGNYIKFLPMVAALGQKAAVSLEGGFEDTFFFGSFRKGVRYGAWSPFYKKMSLYDKEISDIDGLYSKGGIIRFALFMGKTKVLIDQPYDQISDYITGKRPWKNKYQSVFMASSDFDKKNINIPPEYILKNFEQQVPLSYHEIDKKTLKPTWDPTHKKYNIV